QIDKLVSSGTFLRDEVRESVNYEPLPNGEGQKLIMTKNYVEVEGDEKNGDN
ncbi:phage portal protein, partial [Enterococcus faecium]|nr:phage portal protein [Enterococcus faecium]